MTRFAVTLSDGTPLHLMALAPPAAPGTTVAYDPARVDRDGGAMRLARHAFPLAVAAVAAVFLGLFFLLPLIKVFGASILDASGKTLHARELHQRAVEPLLPQRPDQQPQHRGGGLAARRADRRAVCVLPRAAADRRQGGAARARRIAAGAAVVRRRLCAGAAVRTLRDRDRRIAVARHSRSNSIYGAKGIVAVYTLTLYPYVVLPVTAAFKSIDISVEEAAQNLGASRARVLRTVTLPLVLPSILAGGLLVFIEALENFGVPFVLAEDRPILSVEAYKLFVGETTDNPASAGVLGVLLIVCTIVALHDPARRAGAPPLRDRRAPRPPRSLRSAPRCAASAPPIAGSWSAPRWCRSPPWW